MFPIWRASEWRQNTPRGPGGFSGALARLSGFLWLLSGDLLDARDHPGTLEGCPRAQNKSPRLKMEALGGGSPACSCIKMTFLTFFRNIIKRSPGRSRALWNAAYGSPRSSDSSPKGSGDVGGSLGGPWSALRASAGCHLTSLARSKGYLEIIKTTLLF